MRQRWNCKSDSGADLLRERNRDTFGPRTVAQLCAVGQIDDEGRTGEFYGLARAGGGLDSSGDRARGALPGHVTRRR